MLSTHSTLTSYTSWRFALLIAFIFTGLLALTNTTHAAVTPDDPGNFITTWNTENPGTSANNQITIPHANGETYNYEIYWVNTASSTQTGTTTVTGSDIASSPTLTFPEPGIYEVQASGTFPRIFFNNGGDNDKILTVEQWGDIEWTSMASAFRGASNLRVPATDAPDLSGVTNLGYMFAGASTFNDPVNHWDVSNIELTYAMFFGAANFDQPLNNWDVSNVRIAWRMFQNASSFNHSLAEWNTSSFTNIEYFFEGATSFNQPLNNWDVSNVSAMRFLFVGASSFNQPLNNWDVSKVTCLCAIFRNATSFDQPLNNWTISASTTAMWRMFEGAASFNQDLSNWNLASVATYADMFIDATSFDQDLSSWEISSAADMTNMFNNSSLSTQYLNNTLQSWATQATTNNIENVPFHHGLKTYSQTGADAIDTLKGLGWTISEQYQARYHVDPGATLTGSNHQYPLNSGATTTPVEVKPDTNCTFRQWSDGSTQNPRTDVLTDNLTVTADIRCSSGSQSTSVRTQREKATEFNNQDALDRIDERTGTTTTTSTPTTYQPPETLEESLDEVERLPETIDRIVANDPSPETIRSLIGILLALVEALGQLLASGEGA